MMSGKLNMEMIAFPQFGTAICFEHSAVTNDRVWYARRTVTTAGWMAPCIAQLNNVAPSPVAQRAVDAKNCLMRALNSYNEAAMRSVAPDM